ncbi:MAG: YigZ family protein [Bacilli bacterium]|nr:YigZ family protein [Bacilli bacterium]
MNVLTIKEEKIELLENMKSKFYAIAFPCIDVETFKTKLEKVRKDNPKAKHFVYAYRIGVNSKSCDDKEPKGTGGRPILELLNKKNLSNIAIIVVRYYGGVQLGAGRLLRTYLNSAINVLNKCEIIEMEG